MTRILKRDKKTFFKEDVLTCLADETMQKTFTQSEYGNRMVFMEELQDELTNARNRQKEINKILDTSGNENSKVVVEDDLEEEKSESSMEL